MRILQLITLTLSISCISISHAKTFKISSTAPDGSFWMKQMREGGKEIKRLTNGRVKFKFYPGGVMGSEAVVMKKIGIRQLHGAAVSSGVLANIYPDSQIYALPMLFNTYEEVDHVRKIIDKKIIDGLDKAGMVSFGLSEGGFAYAMSMQPIKSTEDLNSHKVWTPTNNKQAEVTLQSFDITPIPLNIGDVLAGLQTNLIDTVAVSPIIAIALQWHTQIKYVTNIPLMYIYATMLLEKKAFNKISNEDQKIVTKVMNEVFIRIDEQNRKDSVSAFTALSNQGIEVILPTKDDLNVWYKKGKSARNNIQSKGIISNDSIDEVKKLLTEFRKKQETLGAAR